MASGPWAISIRTPNKSVMKVIPREYQKESLNSVLKRTKEYLKAIREKYSHRDDVIIEIISRSHAFEPPDGLHLTRDELWCSYCAKARKFKKGQLLDVDGVSYISDAKTCEVCSISNKDFHIRSHNNLWRADR